MPTKDSLWLNHFGHAKQTRPEPCHPYQQHPVKFAQSKLGRRAPEGDIELMTEKNVLGFKPPPRLKQIGNEQSKCMQDCKHRSQ